MPQKRVKIFIPSSSKLSKSTSPKTAQNNVCVVSQRLLWPRRKRKVMDVMSHDDRRINHIFVCSNTLERDVEKNSLGKAPPHDTRIWIHGGVGHRNGCCCIGTSFLLQVSVIPRDEARRTNQKNWSRRRMKIAKRSEKLFTATILATTIDLSHYWRRTERERIRRRTSWCRSPFERVKPAAAQGEDSPRRCRRASASWRCWRRWTNLRRSTLDPKCPISHAASRLHVCWMTRPLFAPEWREGKINNCIIIIDLLVWFYICQLTWK